MTPKRFLTAQDMPIMPWVFNLQTSMVASAPSSQAVYWKERNILPSGKETARWEKSRFSRAPTFSTAVMPEAA